MKTRSHSQLLTRFLGLAVACSLLLLPLGHAGAQDTKPAAYEDLVAKANALLKEGKTEEALAAAKGAAMVDTKRFEAFALAALTLHRLGKSAEAQEFIAKAVALAPEDKKSRLQEMAKAISTPTTPAPVPTKRLSPEAQRQLDVLMLVAAEADRAPTLEARHKLLKEFLTKSDAFVKENSSEVSIWLVRVFAATELDRGGTGWEAGKQLTALLPTAPDEAKVRQALALLDRKGWMGKEDPEKAELAKTKVLLRTTMGEMVFELWPDIAPKTVLNFVKLANSGFYDGMSFHAVVKGSLTTVGDSKSPANRRTDREFTDRPGDVGVLSMSSYWVGPGNRDFDHNSCGSSFSILLKKFEPNPNFRGTVFGKIANGLDILQKIENCPVTNTLQPKTQIGILSLRAVAADSAK